MENNVVYLLIQSDEVWQGPSIIQLEKVVDVFANALDAKNAADSLDPNIDFSKHWFHKTDGNLVYWVEAWVHFPMRRYFIWRKEIK